MDPEETEQYEDETSLSERADSIAVHKQRMQKKIELKEVALNQATERAQVVQDKVAMYREDNNSFTSDVSPAEISPLGSLVQASGDSVILAKKRLGLPQEDNQEKVNQKGGKSRFAIRSRKSSDSKGSGEQDQQTGVLTKIASLGRNVRYSITQSWRGSPKHEKPPTQDS
eukprot:TRINITY_DN6144_c0_g1_i2.p1 TRINITY_DN6144_c0_g1~~TRINITY_DN6144_c0_g1_i2.p1  ORF type:complete len:170 (-),score=35.20 TRINITY_DN6144_c0_g1_i2:328-837(-)